MARQTRPIPPTASPFLPAGHDHIQCQKQALEAAENQCQQEKVKLTPLRREVLELIWQSHRPVKAYDLLDQLKTNHPGAVPTTVYRALDFLLQHELVHRLASLNAFIGCGAPGNHHRGQFLICRECGTVAELRDADLQRTISTQAAKLGFLVDNETIEIFGACALCQRS